MLVSDDDLELLDGYLDGALSDAERLAVRGRLADEPALAEALDELRQQRTVRSAVFAAMEPNDSALKSFTDSVHAAVVREQKSARFNRFTRVSGAAAACIVAGFFAGWVGRGQSGFLATNPHGQRVADVTPSTTTTTVAVQTDPNGGYAVPVVDEYGRTVTYQHFTSQDTAQRFSEDLSKTRLQLQDRLKFVSEETPKQF